MVEHRRTQLPEHVTERTPEALLDLWLGPLRSAGDASRDNWCDRMLRWRVGVFARGAEDRGFFNAQRAWCEQVHREGIETFFAADPAWEAPKGTLAKLIFLDQFPRCVYRGTPVAYANDDVAGPLAERICASGRDLTEYNVVERFWVYVALSHSEDLRLQELCVQKSIRWSEDLVAAVASGRRKLNQYIGWYFIKAFIEHSEALIVFGRFPHRNAILGREHSAGEPHYLTNPARPLWSFTQPPVPFYYAVLGALHRIDGDLDEEGIRTDAVAELERAANVAAPDTLMDVFDLRDADTVSYTTLYQHMMQVGKERAFDAICRAPVVADLVRRIRAQVLVDPDEPWPPKSFRASVKAVIDVAALGSLIDGKPRTTAPVGQPLDVAGDDREGALRVVIRNDLSELEHVVGEVNRFAKGHGLADKAVFEIQLALEEWVMNTISYGFDDAAEHEIRIDLRFRNNPGTLVVDVVDDGRACDPLAEPVDMDMDAFLADSIEGAGVGVRLVLSFADTVEYRRLGGLNHLTLTKGS